MPLFLENPESLSEFGALGEAGAALTCHGGGAGGGGAAGGAAGGAVGLQVAAAPRCAAEPPSPRRAAEAGTTSRGRARATGAVPAAGECAPVRRGAAGPGLPARGRRRSAASGRGAALPQPGQSPGSCPAEAGGGGGAPGRGLAAGSWPRDPRQLGSPQVFWGCEVQRPARAYAGGQGRPGGVLGQSVCRYPRPHKETWLG